MLTEYDRRFREAQIGVPTSTPPFLPSSVPYAVDEGDIPIRKLSPSGHASGFLLYQGYFNMPNRANSYVPYNPNMSNPNMSGYPGMQSGGPVFRPMR